MKNWQGEFYVYQEGRIIIQGHDILCPNEPFQGSPQDLKKLNYSASNIGELLLMCMLRSYQMGANPNKTLNIELSVGLTNGELCTDRTLYKKVISGLDFLKFLQNWGYIR